MYTEILALVGMVCLLFAVGFRLCRLRSELPRAWRNRTLRWFGLSMFLLWFIAILSAVVLLLGKAGHVSKIRQPFILVPAIWAFLACLWCGEALVGFSRRRRRLPVPFWWRALGTIIATGWVLTVALWLHTEYASGIGIWLISMSEGVIFIGISYALFYWTNPCRDGFMLQILVLPERPRQLQNLQKSIG